MKGIAVFPSRRLWEIVHVGFLVGVRNRLATRVNGFWAHLTIRVLERLITGGSVDIEPSQAEVRLRRTAVSS